MADRKIVEKTAYLTRDEYGNGVDILYGYSGEDGTGWAGNTADALAAIRQSNEESRRSKRKGPIVVYKPNTSRLAPRSYGYTPRC
jgi:hypothetical protein